MSQQEPSASKKGFLIKLAAVAVFVALVGLVLLRGMSLQDLKAMLDQVFAWIRGVGPLAYFSAMAVLPSFGFPLLGFVIPAGPVFGPQLGVPTVALLVALSIMVNLSLTYWLGRYAFRPLLEGIVKRLGYSLPKVEAQDYLSLTVLLRVTPGPPFFLQNYLLGLANVPFRIYMGVSILITIPQAIAVVFFGESLMSGKGKVAFIALSLFVAATVVIQWVRRRYSRKKLPAA